MKKIIIKVPGAPAREIVMASGVFKVGRSINTDVRIDHPSVSASHCEIIVNDGTVSVKDLGSTNGTFLDGERVRECQLVPGHSLRLGEVEVLCGATPTAAEMAAAPAPPGPYVARLAPPRPPRRPRSFYKSIPGAFAYPFKRNGLVLLITGSLIFGIISFFASFQFNGKLMAGLVGLVVGAYMTGYIFLYMQTIITSSAIGEEEMPDWPEYESWWDTAALPYFRLVAICAACIAPAVLFAAYAGHVGRLLLVPWLIAGCCYAPMAMLAVAMDDSLAGLNPLLVVPSIMRVPLEYLVSCLLVGLLVFMLSALKFLTDFLHQPFVGQILGMFCTLYIMVVEMRLLGLLYYTRKDRLGWHT